MRTQRRIKVSASAPVKLAMIQNQIASSVAVVGGKLAASVSGFASRPDRAPGA